MKASASDLKPQGDERSGLGNAGPIPHRVPNSSNQESQQASGSEPVIPGTDASLVEESEAARDTQGSLKSDEESHSPARVSAATTESGGKARRPRDFSSVPAAPPRALYRYRGWARLRSMRTAIWLLIAVAAASVAGSLIPQRNNSAARVQEFIADNPFWGAVFDRLMLFEVFTSWWYLSLLGSLLLVLCLCLAPRTAEFFRYIRSLRPAPRPGPPPPVSTQVFLACDLGPEDALLRARTALRRSRWVVSAANENRQFLAEKGVSREGGSLVFHWALLLVFLAGALSVTTKFEGYVALVEGQRWYEGGPVTFDEYSEGALSRYVNRHRHFYLTLEDFEATYRQDGSPEDFVSRIRVELPDGGERTDEIKVNKPLSYKGVKIYQASYGWAAEVEVVEGSRRLYQGPVLFFAEDRQSTGPAPLGGVVGVVKLPSASGGQAGLELRLFPDFRLVPYRVTNPDSPEASDPRALDIVNASDEANRPLVLVTEYRGDLGLDRPQNVYRLDKTRLVEVQQRFGTFPDRADERVSSVVLLSEGLELRLLELKRYSVFQVRSDVWGSSLAALAGAAVFLSLFPALYSWRRRLWVRILEPRDVGQAVAGEPMDSVRERPAAEWSDRPIHGRGAEETKRQDGDRTRLARSIVEVRAIAFQRKELLRREFELVTSCLSSELGALRIHHGDKASKPASGGAAEDGSLETSSGYSGPR